MNKRTRSLRSGGFTLLELTVVLAILAVVTGLAVQSMTQTLDQERYELTRDGLEDIRIAVLGVPNERGPDGARVVSGFVADVGRLPQVKNGALEELYDATLPPGLTAYGLQTAPADFAVKLACGWRGPYLMLPLGANQLRDGWGNPYELLKADLTPAAEGEAIEMIRSLGADAVLGGVGYSEDLVIDIRSAPALRSGYVRYQDGATDPDPGNGPTVMVRVFGIQNGALVTLAQQPKPVAGGDFSYALGNLSPGLIVLRAYQTDTALPIPPSDPVDFAGHAVSVPMRAYAAGPDVDLILQDAP